MSSTAKVDSFASSGWDASISIGASALSVTSGSGLLYLFVRSGLSVGMAGGAVAALGSLACLRSPRLPMVAVASALTFFSYALDRFRDSKGSDFRLRSLFVVGAAVPLAMSYFLAVRAHLFGVVALSLVFPLSVVLYAFPVLPLGRYRRVKDLPFTKSFYVASMWALLPVLAATDTVVARSRVLAVVAFVFGKALCSTIASDIKDLEEDKAAGILTIPVALGKKRTIGLLHLLNVAFSGTTFLFAYLRLVPPHVVLTEIHSIIFAFFLLLISSSRKEWIVSELGVDVAFTLLPVWCSLGQYLSHLPAGPQ